MDMEIRENMEVVDSNEQHVGTVESVQGDEIKLMAADAIDPQRLTVTLSEVDRVDVNKVYLARAVSAITTRAFLSRE